MDGDARSFRVALVDDAYVNPEPGGIDALAILEAEDWGALQLPSGWYPDDVVQALVEHIAEQTAEFARHGYDLVIVGTCAGLDTALSALDVPVPDRVEPASARALQRFLRRRATQMGPIRTR